LKQVTAAPQKYENQIRESVSRLLSMAENSRGINCDELLPRVGATLDKYLLRDQPDASTADIKEFIEALRADDLCLIAACERGDDEAWGDLVLSFGSVVKSTARNFCSNTEDVDDLANSIWAELHGLKMREDGKPRGKIAYYSGRGSLAGWLRAVVHQLAIDQHRKLSRFVQIEEDREFDNLASESAENGDNARFMTAVESPEEAFSGKEAMADVSDALKGAIANLETEDRLIIKLYYFDNLRLKEIGNMLGFHEATASRRLMKVQADVRKNVEKLLQTEKGWQHEEVKTYLAETAAKLGIDLEKMFAVLIFTAILQELVWQNVL
jgi:RNA polymerase sigma-70 factor (ECF subfamily)